jgi:geranylgeranyl pyrophosphate synthase
MADDLESFAANIEGLVFQFNDNIVKLTGSYKYINQVVGFDRYGR